MADRESDLYAVLGVNRDASAEEIRQAYRSKAKTLHPDLHPGDREAEEAFKRLSMAYDILGDAEKRARYDRGEIDATGAERPSHGYYRHYADGDAAHAYQSASGFADFEDLGDVFADLFGRRRHGETRVRVRGADLRYELELDFLEAANGARKRITMPDGRTIDLTVPAGARDGQTLRLKGQGTPGLGGGPAGDALITLRERLHPVFRREERDIHVELPVSLSEAVLGGKVDVPTISGTVSMTVPPGSNTGTTLRLKGRGVAEKTGAPGDQYVTLKVVLPDPVDPDLRAFLQEWGKKHSYDPRTKRGGKP